MATDVYAFGMLLYEVLFRRDPFAGESSEVSLYVIYMTAKKTCSAVMYLQSYVCSHVLIFLYVV